MGPRFSPGISPARTPAGIAAGCAGDRAHRDGHRARPRGHRPASQAPRPRSLRRQFQPPEPLVSRDSQGPGSEAARRVCRQASDGWRDRLLRDPGHCGPAGRKPERAGVPRAPLPCGAHGRRACGKPGAFFEGRGPDHLRDDCVRDGDQQTERALGYPPRPAEKHRGLLPGDRTGWPRRAAGGLPPSFQPRRRGEADAFHRGDEQREGTADRPRAVAPDDALRGMPVVPSPRVAQIFR